MHFLYCLWVCIEQGSMARLPGLLNIRRDRSGLRMRYTLGGMPAMGQRHQISQPLAR